MVKEIRNQVYCMTFVLGMLMCLGLWQMDFIVNAISANLFLNISIFATFGFGTYVAYTNVLSLKNECLAYHALREDYEDVLNSQSQDTADPSWRYYRCNDDAIVFAKPRILEQPFQIISEEIARTNNLSMSTGVMQNLLDSIDDRLDERRSLIQYVTGVLIFLGLIGTFVGLMVTLGSVGGIIGSLDLTGGAGAAAIQGLMEDLKVPLQGMATGFSSSLFGLVTSLALGLMARFANRASGILKMEFETWIAGVAKVDSETGNSSVSSPANMERQLSLMMRVARLALVSNSRVVNSVERVSEAMDQMREMHIDSQKVTREFAESLCNMTSSQVLTNKALAAIGENLENRQEIMSVVDELKYDADRQRTVFESIEKSLDDLSSRQARLQENAHEDRKHFLKRDELNWVMQEAQDKLHGEFGRLSFSVDSLSGALSEINDNIKSSSNQISMSQDKIFKESQELRDKLGIAIEHSRTSIAEAEKLEKSNVDDLSIGGIKERLLSTFPAEKVNEDPELSKPAKRKRGFSLFRRSA